MAVVFEESGSVLGHGKDLRFRGWPWTGGLIRLGLPGRRLNLTQFIRSHLGPQAHRICSGQVRAYPCFRRPRSFVYLIAFQISERVSCKLSCT